MSDESNREGTNVQASAYVVSARQTDAVATAPISPQSAARGVLSSRRILMFATVFIVGISLFLSVQSARTMSTLYENGNTVSFLNTSPRNSSAGASSSHAESNGQEYRQEAQRRETAKKKEHKDMNIVLFYADDWTWRTIGAVNNAVKTPNIDEMAKRGMLFTHNCVTTSICWQSRATLLTGLYVAVHKQLKISEESIFKNWSHTLFPLLKNQGGLDVGYVGKWHAPMTDHYKKEAFDYFEEYYGDHWMLRDGKLRHITALNGEDALFYLRNKRPKNKKFALTVAFFATHSWDDKKFPDQFMPQNHTEHLYADMEIPVPKTATNEHFEALPKFLTGESECRNRWRERYDTPSRYQVTMKRIYRMATEVDEVVGAVVEELKAQGVYNNTLLVFTTDNGVFHGEHQLAGKWYPHEESIRVPLIIQDPRMPESVRGTRNDDFTLNIDLAPTLLSAAGVPVPSYMQGRDIAELYLNAEEASESWRKDFFYEWTQGNPVDGTGSVQAGWIPSVFALVRKDYKYFFWPEEKYEQVFHIENDPFEENDIFMQTKMTEPERLLELQARYAFLKHRGQTGQPA